MIVSDGTLHGMNEGPASGLGLAAYRKAVADDEEA